MYVNVNSSCISYDQPRQHIKKQRHYFANKGPSSQGYGFSSSHVWMWELDCEESWVLKNWCFELWCWRRLLRVPWTAGRSNQTILKEISPGCSLEGLMLKLKLQYFVHVDAKSWLTGKDPDAGRDWGQEEKGTTEDELAGWHHRLSGHGVWVKSRSWWWTGRPGVLQFMGSQRVRHDWATELNWSCQEVVFRLNLAILRIEVCGFVSVRGSTWSMFTVHRVMSEIDSCRIPSLCKFH